MIIQRSRFREKINVFCGVISIAWDDLVNVLRYFGVGLIGQVTLLTLNLDYPCFPDEISNRTGIYTV